MLPTMTNINETAGEVIRRLRRRGEPRDVLVVDVLTRAGFSEAPGPASREWWEANLPQEIGG